MPVDIEFSKHALLKISVLEAHGIRISNEIIEKDSSIIIYSNKLANNKKALELVYKNFFNKQDKAIIGIFDLNDKTEILIYYKNYNSEYNIKKLTEELKEFEFNIDKNFIELKINDCINDFNNKKSNLEDLKEDISNLKKELGRESLFFF